ncbi:hypothetical protein GGS21DRAFT_489291 [Xylaria nigripes]|nr:hypothetical protein GGS21DRAFT_489291 [Xylaria nigripes]
MGAMTHDTLCRRGTFHHGALVPQPSNLNYAQAATLTCSMLAAWNALMGFRGHKVKEGDWALVQGTGGLSIDTLRKANALTPNGRGVDHVIDIGGPVTLPESLKAVRLDGAVLLAGLIGGLVREGEAPVDIMGAFLHICITRGVMLGTREMLRDLIRFVEEKQIQHFAKVIIKMD